MPAHSMASPSLLCLAALLAGCESTPSVAPSSSPTLIAVTVAPAVSHLLPGARLQLTAVPRYGSGGATPAPSPVTWRSEDEARATISSDGLLTALSPGSVVITADLEGTQGTAAITIDEGGVVGPEGGEIRGFDGTVSLAVPAGAVGAATEVFLTRSPAPLLDATNATPEVHIRTTEPLAAPATLTLTYDPDAAPAGIPESALGVRRLSLAGWASVAGGGADAASHTATATVTEDGTYGVGRIAPSVPCTAAEPRQFDFWLGRWDVAPTGSPPGTRQASSVITAEPGGCAVFEDFRDLGVHGVSISLYDPATATWYQTFIDNLGTRLVLAGGLEAGAMLLTAPDQGSRITWTFTAGGVRQFGENSADGGLTWTPGFDLDYQPR